MSGGTGVPPSYTGAWAAFGVAADALAVNRSTPMRTIPSINATNWIFRAT
jgi:hypothetical protein